MRQRLLAATLFALVGILTIACQNSVNGPSLSATVQNLQLTPTVAGVDGGANVCCCLVTGQVTNTSQVGIHVQLTFPAKNAQGTAVGTAVDFERDIAAGAPRAFTAAGIQAACKDVNLTQVNADKTVRVLGLWEYPQ
jgi:hypothetical protein